MPEVLSCVSYRVCRYGVQRYMLVHARLMCELPLYYKLIKLLHSLKALQKSHPRYNKNLKFEFIKRREYSGYEIYCKPKTSTYKSLYGNGTNIPSRFLIHMYYFLFIYLTDTSGWEDRRHQFSTGSASSSCMGAGADDMGLLVISRLKILMLQN